MGLLARWDRRNQRTLEAQNQAEDSVSPGVVFLSSVLAILTIAVGSVGVAVAGVASGQVRGFVVAVAAVLIGGGLCVNLGQDVREDIDEWTRRRRRRS